MSTALAVACALAALCAPSAGAATRDGGSRAGAQPNAASLHARATRRARVRRQLLAQLHRDPRVVLRKAFLKKAVSVDFKLPLTVVLNTQGLATTPNDDVMKIAWDTQTQAWPLGAGFQPWAPVNVVLDGSFAMEWNLGSDTSGYSTLGVSEITLGQNVKLTGSAFPISDFDPTCATPKPAVAATSYRPTGASSDVPGVKIDSAGNRLGTFNPFAGKIQGTLNLHMRFRSTVASSCTSSPDPTTRLVDPAPAGPGAAGAAPPIPLRFSGDFDVSPAVTIDGHIRFGKITVDAATMPQLDTFAQIFSCYEAHAVPDTETCAPSTAAAPGQEVAKAFPARVSIVKLTADVIVGDAA